MKTRQPHIVPLSAQAVAILHELQSISGDGRLLFPSLRSAHEPLSDGTLNAALRTILRKLGLDPHSHVSHGFRSSASSLLNEQGFAPDVIEKQLAHVDKNAVRAAYNHSERLPERRAMMQSWSNYLDGLKAGGNVVVPIHRHTAA